MQTETTDKIQSQDKHWQFKQGESGNPSGRPVGSRNKATLAVQALFEGEAEAISRKAIELALAGDITAIRFVLERIMPPRKDSPVLIDLPQIDNAKDTSQMAGAVLNAVAVGEITPIEAAEVNRSVETYIKALEINDFELRLKALETKGKA